LDKQLDIDANAQSVRDWLTSFMAKPNANLGRAGAVCPFVPSAIAQDTIRLLSFSGDTIDRLKEITRAEASALQVRMKERPDQRPLHVTIMLFPTADSATIDAAQDQLKEELVDLGLMIGEFHPKHSGPGLHNPNFQPMRAPVPLLVLREMVRQDLVFLSDEKRYGKERIQRFVASFHRLFTERRQCSRANHGRPS
jgi:hypothetical protein